MVLKLPEYGQKIHEIHVTFVSVVYWPGLDNDIDKIILTCKQCQEHLPSNPREPNTIKPRPGRPFPELAADFCSYASQDFLILVDCYSNWPDVIHMGHNITTLRLITALKKYFCRSGVPDILWSDSTLLQRVGIPTHHIPTVPTIGKIDATVKSMKKPTEASWMGTRLDKGKLARALLQYRNTPSRRDGLSATQKLFGRPVQDTLPAHSEPLPQSGNAVRKS